MKKIILGLFFTLSFSGVALAGNFSIGEVKDLKKSKSGFEKKLNTLDLKKLFDCYYVTKIRIKLDGHNYDVTVDEGPAPCNPEDADGTIGFKFIGIY